LCGVSAFWRIVINDLWKEKESLRLLKIFVTIPLVLLPEIGTLAWAIFFAQRQELHHRMVAVLASSLYLLLQFGIFYTTSNNRGYLDGIIAAVIMHLMWLPLIIGFSAPLSRRFLSSARIANQ
jgi:hypothetical protein